MSDLSPWRDLAQDPPPATPATLAEVQRRARRHTRRRRAAVAASAALVLLAAGGATTWAVGDRPASRNSVYIEEPAPTPRPGCATFACPERDQPPAADCDDGRFDYCPDGKPGWSTGSTACRPTQALDGLQGSRPPAPGVQMTLELSDGRVPAGTFVPARVVIRNAGGDRVRFTPFLGLSQSNEAKALGTGGGNAQHSGDVGLLLLPVDLEPDEAHTIRVWVPTVACADTRGVKEPTLPPGTYQVTYRLGWRDVAVGGGAPPSPAPSGFWVGTAELQVTS